MTQRLQAAADAWGSILRVHAALVPLLDDLLRHEAGLSLAWYDVLLELAGERDGRLRMSELGTRVVLSRSRVSRLVDELADAGLVRRRTNPQDGRSLYAVLTAKGRAAQRRAAPVYLRAIQREFGAELTVAELTTITRALDGVLRRLR